ncbi:MAG: hypothetical protein AAF558_11300, partial [Verrucomicrobiota bacterium]
METAEPATSSSKLPSFDAKQVYADLCKLAETPARDVTSERAILAYILAMTNGQAAFFFANQTGSKTACKELIVNKDSKSYKELFINILREEWEKRSSAPGAFIVT